MRSALPISFVLLTLGASCPFGVVPCESDDDCGAGGVCVDGACAAEGEGEGDVVVGEGEGDVVVGEGEGDVVVGEGEGDVVVGEGEGEGDFVVGEGEGEGEVLAPEFTILSNTCTIGVVNEGAPVTCTVTVENSGLAPLTLQPGSQLSVTTSAIPPTVDAGQSVSIDVTAVNPAGTFSGSFELRTNDADEATVTVNVTATVDKKPRLVAMTFDRPLPNQIRVRGTAIDDEAALNTISVRFDTGVVRLVNFTPGSPAVSIDESFTYVSSGARTITVTVSDDRGQEATATADQSFTGFPSAVDQGWLFSGNLTNINVASPSMNMSPARFVANRAGPPNKAIDVSSGDILSTSRIAAMSNNFTVSHWMLVDSNGGNFFSRVSGQGQFLSLWTNGTSLIVGDLNNESDPPPVPLVTAAAPSKDAWHHLAWSVSLAAGVSTLSIYVDGALAARNTTARAFPNPNSCRFFLAHHGDDGDNCTSTSNSGIVTGFPALFDDVRVYGRALSDEEVQLLAAEVAP